MAVRTTGRLLGVQIVGTGDVSRRLATGAMALHGNMGISDMVNLDLPYAPPFSPAIDNFIAAVHLLESKWQKLYSCISSAELKKKLDAGEKPLMLDMRGPDEFEQMELGIGEKLIPLGALRSRLNELPADKNEEIITFCKISLRGYEGSCILKANGYTNVKVLEGGLLAWPFGRKM